MEHRTAHSTNFITAIIRTVFVKSNLKTKHITEVSITHYSTVEAGARNYNEMQTSAEKAKQNIGRNK